MHKLLLPIAILAITGCASARWRANTPRQITANDPGGAFETALATVRGEGYTVTELDSDRGYFRVKSKVDGDMRGHVGWFGSVHMIERVTYLSFQVQPQGILSIAANGYHVRGPQLHALVSEEIDRLAACIQDRTRVAISAWKP
jgi:hypothetical protein